VSLSKRHRFPSLRHHPEDEPNDHEIAEERAPHPIWLPQIGEPVTLVAGRETLPARVVERAADMLEVAIVVPSNLRESQLARLVLEYANPGGRVRLAGETTQSPSPEGAMVRIDRPRLLEVIQDRVHVRVDAECPIVIKTARQTLPIHSHTIDVSAGGVLLGTPEALQRGEQLDFQLMLEPGAAPVAGKAEVVRMDVRGRAGIQFSQMSPFDQWRLIRFTIDCQGKGTYRHPELDARGPTGQGRPDEP
jgi:PilZ domain